MGYGLFGKGLSWREIKPHAIVFFVFSKTIRYLCYILIFLINRKFINIFDDVYSNDLVKCRY